jgi:hypothetical protein
MPLVRRLGRVILNVLTALSLVTCVGVCVLWVRSYRVTDRVAYRTSPHDPPQRSWAAMSAGGRFLLTVHDFYKPHLVAWRGPGAAQLIENRGWNNRFGGATDGSYARWSLVPGRDKLDDVAVFGFKFEWKRNPENAAVYRHAAVPYYALAGAWLALPLWRMTRRVRRRRAERHARAGLCPACGYDLRATPGRCPECGREAVTTTT